MPSPIGLANLDRVAVSALGDDQAPLLAPARGKGAILPILRTLEGKGYVGHEQEGRGHRYFAAVKQQVAQRSALRHLTGKLFKGSAELLFTHLVSDQKLSAKQIRSMRALLEGKLKGEH